MFTENQKGFTLIELLVVISVIGFLASIILVSLNGVRAKARDAKRIADLKQITTALELFYDNYGKYPRTLGMPSWEGHWLKFKTCLLTGVGCQEMVGDNSVIANYQSVLAKVPDDPLNKTPDVDDGSITYFPPYNACNDQMYALRVQLETDHPVLQSDSDGDFYTTNDTLCSDATYQYCIKVNLCR